LQAEKIQQEQTEETKFGKHIQINSPAPCSLNHLLGEMVGVGGIAPPRLTVSETGPSAVRGKPHAD